jgi:DNA-binding NarL/FixJ family response regulator
MLSILILENDAILREHFYETLLGWHLATTIQTCSSNAEAHALITAEKFDLLLADLNVDDGDGSETISLLSQMNPESITIVISGISEPNRIIRAIQKGAVGYLQKSDSSMQLIISIEKALSGQSPISPEIAMVICKSIHDDAPINDPLTTQNILTPRETEVINLVARGLSYAEISDILKISKNTLPVHIRNIYEKLRTNNRTGAVFEARSLGIID